ERELGAKAHIHGSRLVLGERLERSTLGGEPLCERSTLVVLNDGAGLGHVLILMPSPARLFAEREVESLEKRARFIIRLGRRANPADHATVLINLVVVDFRENDAFLDAHGV